MPPHDPFDDDDEDVKSYHESSDEDFNPTAAPADESSASSDEDNATGPVVRKGKRKAPPAQEFDSGDEATIEAAKKRRTKRRKGDNVEEDEREDDDLPWSDHEGGEGGLVKTRAQRRVEQKERRPLARTDGATVDVDALWATMSAVPLRVVDSAQPDDASAPKDEDMGLEGATVGEAVENEGDLVSIRRTYTFAGQVRIVGVTRQCGLARDPKCHEEQRLQKRRYQDLSVCRRFRLEGADVVFTKRNIFVTKSWQQGRTEKLLVVCGQD